MNHSFSTKQGRRLRAAALLASLLGLVGCDAFNEAYYNAQHTDDNAALGEQIMDQHYLNGDLTPDQFHQQVQVFNPDAQLPPNPAPPDATDATKPAPPVATSP
jgi:hypothetical protein